jgi:transposase InsO family protein
MGPKECRSTTLSREEEAIAVAFRKHTLLPQSMTAFTLCRPPSKQLTRSALHRCFQRHGISRLPHLDVSGASSIRKKFRTYPIGYFHIDLAEVATAEGKLYLFVAIDRTSKFAFARLVARADTKTASDFLNSLVEERCLITFTPCSTDNGIQFADLPKNRSGPTAMFRGHPFDRACRRHGIEHRLTKPNHPW